MKRVRLEGGQPFSELFFSFFTFRGNWKTLQFCGISVISVTATTFHSQLGWCCCCSCNQGPATTKKDRSNFLFAPLSPFFFAFVFAFESTNGVSSAKRPFDVLLLREVFFFPNLSPTKKCNPCAYFNEYYYLELPFQWYANSFLHFHQY